MNAQDLKAFEEDIAQTFSMGRIPGPVHLSGGNEQPLIELFKQVHPSDWVLSTWRSHYHALLKGVPPARLRSEILAGRSMNLHFPEYRFLTSAIVGGILPIACGLAAGGARVWCFVGDMAASTGLYKEATQFAVGHNLPIHFVTEDNGLSTNTPTAEAWGDERGPRTKFYRYSYTRAWPHYQPLSTSKGF